MSELFEDIKINIVELLQKLGNVSISTVYRWQKQKGLPRAHRDLGKQEVYWLASEISEWFDGQKAVK